MSGWLQSSPDPAIRRLAGDPTADPQQSPRAQELLRFPDAGPYRKWWGTHWRLVELADLALDPDTPGLDAGIDRQLRWLSDPVNQPNVITGRHRQHASIEGNALYVCSTFRRTDDPRVRRLVDGLLEWQWPDGGWNCDVRPEVERSSFHETWTPALGLATYAEQTGNAEARAAADRAAERLLDSELYKSRRTGQPVHPSWAKPHYPPYWHYDLLQGLRVLRALGRLDDPRADDARRLLAGRRRRDGRFSGPSWASATQQDAVDWGRGAGNEMLNLHVESVLVADQAGATRPPSQV